MAATSVPKGTYGKRAAPATGGGIPKATYGTAAARKASGGAGGGRGGGRAAAASSGRHRREITPAQLVRGGRRRGRGFARGVTVRKGSHHVLMSEYLLFCLIVALRAAADYVPSDGGDVKGKITPAAGQLGPIPVWAGGTGLFFLLSFAAARGGTAARVAAAAGALPILVLLMRSGAEMTTVSNWYSVLGGGKNAAGKAPAQTGVYYTGQPPDGTTIA